MSVRADPVPPEPPSRGWWLTRRFAIAAVGVVLLSGAATAVLALNEVGKIVEALGQRKAVKLAPHVLAAAPTGAPETLLLVGNDQRPPPKGRPNGFVLPHSNEMLLVRLDPGAPTISMMSIPRELQVPIHPNDRSTVLTRINAALAFGGIELMTKTIEQVLRIPINHVFVASFPRFKQAVDEMGCVYMTVDRRYYHRNEPGGEQYFEINLQPGYQRLCGPQALEFVANRHEDTSLVRDARDQRFLLEVKAQYGPTLFEDRDRFEHIFGKAVETDLHGSGAVLDLLRLLVASAGKPVRQVHFEVNLGATVDTATPRQIAESVRSFLTGTAAISTHHVASSAVHGAHHRHHGASIPGLTPTTAEELDHARSQAPKLAFPLEYPRARQSFGGARPDELRTYDIRDPHGRLHPAYVVVVDQGQLGQFYDVQGTSWDTPPVVADPEAEVRIGRRTYGLLYAGEQLRAVAWREAGAVYWVENTLTNALSPRVMLEIAQETTPVISIPGVPAAPSSPGATQSFKVPARPVATASLAERVAAVLGLAGILAVAGLAALVLVRQRQVRELRAQVADALGMEARLRPLLAAAGIATAAEAPARTAAAAPPVPAPAVPPRTSAGPGVPLPAARTPPASAPAAAPSAPAASAGAAGAPASPIAGAPASQARSVSPGQIPSRGRTAYRARRRLNPGVALIAVLALALAGGIAGYLASRSGGPPAGRGAAATGRSLPVSVYNATRVPGVAHRVASKLRAERVHIVAVGNINSSTLGPGTFVLYPHGASRQAHSVAALLPGGATVTPIQPQVQSAIGHRDQIVVVLD